MCQSSRRAGTGWGDWPGLWAWVRHPACVHFNSARRRGTQTCSPIQPVGQGLVAPSCSPGSESLSPGCGDASQAPILQPQEGCWAHRVQPRFPSTSHSSGAAPLHRLPAAGSLPRTQAPQLGWPLCRTGAQRDSLAGAPAPASLPSRIRGLSACVTTVTAGSSLSYHTLSTVAFCSQPDLK